MNTYIAFRIDNDDYGLDLRYVKEVLLAVAIRKIPHSLPFVKGVMNVRGHITPVIDLKRLFSNSSSAYSIHSHIVIAQHQENLLAFIVDEVYDVLTISSEQLQKPQQTIPISSFLDFVGEREGRLLLLLNLPKIMETARLCSVDRALEWQTQEKIYG